MPRSTESAALELDLQRYELHLNGRTVRLEKIPMELLILLVEGKGQLVERDTIVKRLWGDKVFVDTEQGINTAVRKIRLALRDDPEQPRFVQTVVGKGYRFLGPISVVDNNCRVSVSTPSNPPEHPVEATTRRHPWPMLALVAAVALFGAFAATIVLKVAGFRTLASAQDLSIHSLAVLPLEDLSGDHEQEYLADGITDALITNLAQIRSLRVISRSSSLRYRGSRKSLPEIAKELNVDAVVEGTLSRSGNRVRITAQLIKSATDQHIWAETYERSLEDVLTVQSDIALNVARKISSSLTSQAELRFAPSRRIDPEAQEAFLRGRYLLGLRGPDNLMKAPFYFQVAVEKDPMFAEAYAGLAESYGTLAGWGLVRSEDIDAKEAEAARKAVELDDNSSTAHTALAAYMCSHKDREGIEHEIHRALELNANNSTAHKLYGLYLHLTGQLDAAIVEEMRAQDLDPLAAHLNLSLGHVLYEAKRFDDAVSQWRRAIELDPNLRFLQLNIGWAYAHQGMHEAAVREWLRYWEASPRIFRILNTAYTRSGYSGYLRAQLGSEFANAFLPRRLSEYQRAVIFIELGENDHALQSLAKAIPQHDEDLEELLVDVDLERLRSTPRFQAIVQDCRANCGEVRPF